MFNRTNHVWLGIRQTGPDLIENSGSGAPTQLEITCNPPWDVWQNVVKERGWRFRILLEWAAAAGSDEMSPNSSYYYYEDSWTLKT
jgi:hypothetical protein